MKGSSLLFAVLICEFILAYSQTSPPVYHQEPVPNPFTLGTRYPNRTEDAECRPIKLRLRRNSVRFRATIIQNSNTQIQYSTSDASLMTSRMKSRLDILASWYYLTYGTQLVVLMSYIDGNDPDASDSSVRSNSLHYEGRSARIRGSIRSHLSAIAHQAVLSGFDWVYYADQDYCRVSVIPDVCQTDIDLVFLVDESGSVGSTNYELAVQFMQSVVNFFDVEENRTRVAMISFSTNASINFVFNEHLSNQEVNTAIGNTRYNGGWTHTAWALYYARLIFYAPNLHLSGARPLSAGFPRVVVLITDGHSNHYRVDGQSMYLRQEGATIYSVGVANYDIDELNLIASDPDSEHVFLLQSYTDAASFVQLLSGTTCDTPANLPPGNEAENECEEDDFRYFQIECPAFSGTVIVEQIDIVGHCAIYVSTTIVNPGPLDSANETHRDESIDVSRRRVIITISITRTIYVSIRGITPVRNRFRIVVWNMLFAEDIYSVTVPNGVLTTSSIIDLDIIITNANDNNYFFSITEGNEGGKFRIVSNTGEIYLTEALNAQEQDFYNLTVVAYLRSNDCQRGRTYVEVYVSAANQYPPVLQATTPVSVLETSPSGRFVASVTATDADFGVNGEVRYSITGGNIGSAFAIDSVTGDITVAGALNHTIRSSYTLTLTATDQATTNVMTDTTTQVIDILDVNQSPFFLTACANMGLCNFRVREDAASNVILHTISAGDPDLSTNGQLTYVLTPSMPFSINNAGGISLASSIDRETQASYSLNLTVNDGGTPSLTIRTPITYAVIDVNDNAPVVTVPQEVTISEGAFVGDGVLQASASDDDIGSNAQVTYTLHNGSPFFAIDELTGAVTLAASLDYERNTEHSIVISASNPDGLQSSLRTSTVLVLNENDNSPIFTLNQYTASVTEGSTTGTPVVTVQADDADSGTLGEVSYSITGGNSNNNFAIDSTSGMITVSGDIDREVISEYILTIRAQDGGSPARSDRSTVIITVNDINDNSPIFQRSLYAITVREDINVPSDVLTLLATDADEASSVNSAITYSIQTGNDNGDFSLDTNTGVLSVIRSLDFESTPSYSLNVVATDGGSRTGNAVVTVTVSNVNDEAPTLSGSQAASIPEDSSIPREVASFTASGEMGEVLQFQLSGDQNGEFEIDINTGQVSLVQSLDYESRQEYTLTVSVTDGQFSNSLALTVTVTDVNDNAPIIDPAGPFSIMEQQPDNILVGSVTASDQDSGSNAQLSFRITQQPPNLFMIVSDGSNAAQIRTANVLDREALVQMNYFLPPNSQADIIIEVSDNGNPRLTSSVTVVIRLQDINDNAPTLDNPVSEVSISESSNIGTPVTQVVASDIDIGVNARVSYSLRGSSLFTIDSSTGDIILVNSLDYETSTEHMIMVTAFNPDGVNSTEHNITVYVIDENDNSPEFTMNRYTASVDEHLSPGTSVLTVEANDADSGTFGEVSYSIMSGNIGSAFAINDTTGLITINTDIDREIINAYTLTIVASNPGMLSRMSTARVEITIIDINDNRPLFMQPRYALSIREDAPLSTILTVIVTDADEPGNPNSQFDIIISSGNDNLFAISSPNGVLTLSSSLDFEVQSSHELILTATDQGSPSLSSTAVVQIAVINVNDNPPVISDNQTVQISELTMVGSNITQFTATTEQDETLQFSIMSNNLLIDSASGVITLARALDYEAQQSFIARVSVSDGLFSSSAYLTVNVVDENDNAPQIAPTGPFTVTEEIPTGILVGTVLASDADSVSNGVLMFSFLGTDALNYFSINSSNGEIRTVSVLDREALTNEFSPPGSSRVFTVSVSDGDLSTTADVTFRLLDINDNAPMFTNLLSQYNIDENSPIGMEVLIATATDADLGSNAIVSYSISPSSPFTINGNTGSVTVASSLDYEDTIEYTVMITASDGTLLSMVFVTIRVIDVNDNPPIFSMSSYTAEVAEHSSINTLVTTALATDADSEAFGMISYTLEGDNGVFRINSTTGEVVINQDIDREVITQFSFTVVASDGGNPAMSATSSVVVTITDINDNPPIFQQSSYTVRVREDSANLTEIITLLATDADEVGNPNSQIDYSFESNSSVFSISSSGVITLTSSLDFEALQSYTLTPIATDRGDPVMNGSTTVMINVINVNDQPPVLTGDQSITLSEWTAVSDQIARFNATSNAGEALTYQLTGTQNGEFEIDASTGVVILVRSLDYETTQFYALTVNASDSAFSTLSAFNITVTDENDNIPQFEAVSLLEITEEQSIGTRVGQVSASDADSGQNAVIAYSFVQSSTQNYFSINSNTGEIVTASTLDRELLVQENLFLPPSSQITFQVQATDMGNPPLFSQTDVTVQLNDLNDNRPTFVNNDRQAMIEESAAFGDTVITVSATDADIANNSLVSYTLSGSAFFAINSTSGVISVAQSLDYEMAQQHELSITASNPDGLTSIPSHNITIIVTDVNDNPPIFTMAPYTASVVEGSSTGTLVVTVQATDADSGLFGQVQYSIVTNVTDVFTINETSGAISINGNTDRESINSYTFTVQASDSGSTTAQTAVTTVTVTITDINDNSPVFGQSVYQDSVREDVGIPNQLFTVTATDADQADSPNAQISYSIADGFGIFEIDDVTGSFTITDPLDFETQSSYSLQVMATDSGQPSLTGTAQIMINIINVNDQTPQISRNQMIELSELTTTMSRVTQFTASGEEGETLVFSLAGNGAGIVFDINPTTGIVTLLTSLDYEAVPFYSYMVNVSDGVFTSSASLNITILDENDNTPRFTSNNLIVFEEEQPTNTVIGQINATDSDSGVNGQLTYSFVLSRANAIFTINASTGEISTAVMVDREGLAAMNALIMQSRIMFDVQVSDGGNPARFSTQTITFEITDINDNAPELVNPPTMVGVSEAAITGYVVTDLQAVDRDLGQNAIISYSLTGATQFTINSTTGVITLVNSLDYETSTEHVIMVTASNPDGVNSTEHNITVYVIDENDNSPIFTMDPYRVSVDEHSVTGTPVITVLADDADSGVLGQVRYSITSGNTDDAFIISSATGIISINNDVDREMLDAYTLGVMATDGGSRSTQSTVEISITDINDNSPVFNPLSYSVTVNENATINSTLVSVTATDADADGPNSDISYSIQSGNDESLFRISSTGVISIISALDYETAVSHSLIVQAMDNGIQSRSSTAVVSVNVMDINDEPVTLDGDQVVNVTEYTTVNRVIAQFRVPNVEQSDNISFAISGDQVEDFRIDPVTGAVTLAQSLDYETRVSYALIVTVSDGIFSDSAQLTVNVLDENDNQPILDTTDPLMIEEEINENALVGQVVATDADSGLNGQLEFSIISNIGDGLFSINASTGMIRTAAVLDREELVNMNLFVPPGSRQILVVQAEDRGTPSLFSQANVVIQLLDINDNSPQYLNEPSSSISLPENIPIGTFILDASATDADLGANGEVSYSLTSDTPSLPFSIDPSTGAITTTSTLDREQTGSYTINITATDNGTPNRLTLAIVTINVTDINDNTPMFLQEPYQESIPEDASTDGGGSIDLLRVFAIDADVGINAMVTYSLAPDTNSRFSIRSTTGQLRVSGGINFEEESEFNITVIARDMGVPSLSSTTIARIIIINVDEFAPVFLGSCDASISEARNISRDSNPVTQCIAVDQDSGMVDYSIRIEPNNPALTTFLLNQITGEVFLTESLDRETIDSYQFTLQASSGGSLVTTMLVTITIEDVNDNAPVFNPSQIAVTYDDPQTQTIATLTVSDDDINENGEFSVDITSVVRTDQPDGHEIIITAVDMGTPSMSGSATVVVTNTFPCQIMEFSLDPNTLELNVATLCSLSNPPVSQDYLIDTEVTLDCSVESNVPVTYQWQLNGSFITNPSSNPMLDLGRMDFDDIGTYSCIARTDIGSIQSDTAFIGINTPPVIVRPPESNALEEQRPFSLACFSTGIPDPTVTFFHNSTEVQLSNRISQHGHFLVVTDAGESDSGEYYCIAENIAGVDRSDPARIVVFSDSQLVTTSLLINNPSDDGTCHNLDIGMMEELLQNSTGYGAEVTDTEAAEGFCDSGPCYPNPCMNGGSCLRNNNTAGGYECTCPNTFEGKNCKKDIDECSVEGPCFAGTCTNTNGSFLCTCPPDRNGHRCQYQTRCVNDTCTNGTTCVETLVNIDGYVCDSTPEDMTVTISLNDGVNLNQLDEAVYDLANVLVMMSTNSRRKRQISGTSSDVCEPRFIPLNDNLITFKLIWACPNGTTPPSSDIEELICMTLLDNNIIADCIYSNGESAVADVQSLAPIEVLVTFLMLNLTGCEAVEILCNRQTLTDLETAGFQVSKCEATVPSTGTPRNECSDSDMYSSSNDEGLGGGAIAGIVIGVLTFAIVATVVGIIVLYYSKTYKKRARYGINESKTVSTLRNIERGQNRTQTFVGVIENPTFRRSVMLETSIPSYDGKDLAIKNPDYQDAPKITKMDGNTAPINKSAINHL